MEILKVSAKSLSLIHICSRSQGLGCSPIKEVRELGSERRETVRSLSAVGVGNLLSLIHI